MATRSNLFRYCNLGEHVTRDNAPRTLIEQMGQVLTLGWFGFIYNIIVIALMMTPTGQGPFNGLVIVLTILFCFATGWLFAVDIIYLAIVLCSHRVIQKASSQFWADKGYVREGFSAPKGYDRDDLIEISNEKIFGR